ncbi:hypothetical protein [Streptomyces sp.]|uniref:hypothetical protein n=1 Tax=Streptomyces sp. TaxID=1931 RepID=UPI002D55CAE1|nr:hypothetical protein [Streptomyces sp.]HZF90121.1 hypothetical protein [Streptomyces sp.]
MPVAELVQLRQLTLHRIDVRAWPEAAGFPPPAVRDPNLYDCVLPGSPEALDFPGVTLPVHRTHHGPALPRRAGP